MHGPLTRRGDEHREAEVAESGPTARALDRIAAVATHDGSVAALVRAVEVEGVEELSAGDLLASLPPMSLLPILVIVALALIS